MNRRRLLRWLGCGCAGLAGVDALLIEPTWLDVTEHVVAVDGLPATLEGLTVAQLSDLHMTGLTGLHEALRARLDAIDPQIVAYTGDVLEDAADLPVALTLMRELSAKSRTAFATLGNWEHWGGLSPVGLEGRYRDVGVRLLDNDAATYDVGVSVIGIGDACSGHDNAALALSRERKIGPRLLLTHAPGVLDTIDPAAGPTALSLAGHTHGGQMRAGPIVPWTPPGSGRFVAGTYETPTGATYVSRGLGTSLLAARLSCRPELAIFRWTRA